MADHFAGPRRRTEDVQALGRGGRPGRSAGPVLGDPRQGFGSDRKILSDRRHSGSRARRVLDPPVSGEGRDREPRGGRGLDRGFAASSPRQDRQDRWGGAAARVAGVQARRAAGVLHGAGSHAGGRGSASDLSRAQDADRRADTACQSDQRPAVFSGDRRLRAAAPGSTPSAGGGSHGRRACAGREHEGANRTRTGSARIAARPDRGDRGRTRGDVGGAGRGRGGPGRPGRARAGAEADGPERPGRGNRARGRGGPGRPEADGSERPGRGNRGHALDGGVLPLVRQSPQLAAFVGLAGTPWKSGSIDHEQGVSMGNHRLRQTMIQLAWLWPIHQPNSALTRWYRERTKGATKLQKKKMVVALARKLLVALWPYVDAGVMTEGAVLKRAARAR